MPRAHAAVPLAVAVAALSLLAHRALAFDPEAWVVWGREARSLAIDTSAGPSWKPLPVLVAAILGGNPWLWLVVARAGALLALVAVGRLVWARAGGAAAAVAVALIGLSPWWLLHTALGNAEPLLVAIVAWAAVAHDDRRFAWALGLGCAAALVRPEVWPFLAVYAVWLARASHVRPAAVAGAGAAVLALWVVPDLVSDRINSAARAAHDEGSPGSAGRSDVPFAQVLRDAGQMLTPALLVALFFLRRADRAWLAAGAGWVALIAVMAQAGFAGNPRYLVPGAAALLAAAAVAVRPPGLAALMAAGALAFNVADLPDVVDELGHRQRVSENLEALAVPPRCRPARAPFDQRTLAARVLDQRIPQRRARARLTLDGERWTLRC